MMRITFILISPKREPVGGYRVIYEYADRLAAKGHKVTVLHSLVVPFARYKRPFWLRYIAHYLLKTYIPRWFNFKNQVNLAMIPEITDKYIPDGDAVIATWWATAYPVSELNAAKGRKFYLIQHYEVWGGVKDLVEKSYSLGLNNIVIAGWLKEILEKLGARVASHIPNGMNFDLFKLKRPIEDREHLSIAMMYHEADWKGSRDGIKAIEIVKDQFPDLTVTVFSVYPKPSWLPGWIHFVQNPAQSALVDLYNSHAIFISPSWTEGWPLPPAEALACGCALVSTDIGGVHDYAVNEKTALLSPPKDPEAMAKNLVRLLNDKDLRIRLAKDGHELVQNFTWENAVTRLEKVLFEGV